MNIPQTLRDALSASKVIPFAGAGVSMAVFEKKTTENENRKRLFPSWKELLEKAAERLDGDLKPNDARLIESFLAVHPPQYLQAAEWAKQALGPVLFEIVGREIDIPFDRVDPATLELARALWNLGSKLIITTNYDRVLRWACPLREDLNEWNIQSPVEQAALQRNGVRNHTIWHLHGRIDDKASLILTPDGYARLYHPDKANGEQSYEAALTTLRSLAASHTLLFVGFGMEDEIGAQLKSVSDIFRGANGPHYVLVREAERERIINLNLPAEIITYADHGEPLLALLHEMAGIVENKPKVAPYDPRNLPFNVPYPAKGDQVVGREGELAAVRRQLTAGKPTAIGQTASFQGLGGLGKTQLAVEYAWKYRDSYPNGVVWLNADQDMDAQLIDLSEKARWVAPESDHKTKLDVALHRLKSYSDFLLIFDNLEAQETIQEYLPQPPAQPHILVTSRDEQPGFLPIGVPLLDAELSLQLITQEAGREPNSEDEWQAARDIVSDLDGLPLALELAGAYLHYRPVTWAQYRDLRRQRMQAAILPKHRTFTRHDTDIYSTLRVSEELLEEEPRLRDILDLLTWSGSAPMGLSLMMALLNVEDEFELTGALSLGVALRLLRKSENSESYAIHRLLGEVRRAEKKLDDQQTWVNDICERIGDWFQERREDFTDLTVFEAEIDHLRAWQEHAAQLAPTHVSRLTWLQAYPPSHRGRYEESQQWIKQALERLDQTSKNQVLQAHLLSDFGTTEHKLGRYETALRYFERALEIRKEVLGEKHPDTANSLNSVGSAYSNLGDAGKTLEYFEQALKIQREVLGEKHPDTAGSLNGVGMAYRDLGDAGKTLEYFEQALEINREVSGEKHPDTATSLNNVGMAYRDVGDADKALEHSKRALEIQREVLGQKHPDTATSLNNVGAAYRDLGDAGKTLKYLEQALEIKREVLGEKHPDTATALNSVGVAYGDLGNFRKAIEYQKQAVEITAELLGHQHPSTLLYIRNLAAALNNLGQRWQAFQLLDKTLRDLPRDNPRFELLAQTARNLVKILPPRRGFRPITVQQAERNWGKGK